MQQLISQNKEIWWKNPLKFAATVLLVNESKEKGKGPKINQNYFKMQELAWKLLLMKYIFTIVAYIVDERSL